MRYHVLFLTFILSIFSLQTTPLFAESSQVLDYELNGSIYNLLDVQDVNRMITENPDSMIMDEDMIIPRTPRVVIVADSGGGACYDSLTSESIGNIHFGHVGSVLFSEQTLKKAAGVIQATQNYKNIATWLNHQSFFDDPNDQIANQRGIDWYQNGYFR